MPLSKTPRSDALEKSRRSLGQIRTAAYGDALRLCRKLETELLELRKTVIAPDSFYKLGGQVDDIVASHVLQEARRVCWCSISQEWVEV